MFVALPVQATEVFLTVGEFGEASFSDEASAGASVIELTTREPDPGALARAAANLERTWVLAREMEASRLAREAARRKRDEFEPRPQPVYLAPEPRVIVGYGRLYRPHRRQQGRPHHRQQHRLHHQRVTERTQPQTPTLRKPLRWTDGH